MRAVMMLVVMVLTTMTAWADNVNNKMRNYWIGNTYYVTDDETVNECMNVTADMTWIISEGVTLTATEGITIAEGHTLTIGGMGTLIATGQRGANATGGASGNSPMYRNGDNGTAAIIGNIIVNGRRWRQWYYYYYSRRQWR